MLSIDMKVVYRKLGKERADGQALIEDGIIEIDPRLKGRRKMEVLIHEAIHLLNPEFSETKVIEQGRKIANLLWKQHFRQVDNTVKQTY
jgi:hypothetical protein